MIPVEMQFDGEFGQLDNADAYEWLVLGRYRLYSGLFLGLPFERLQRTAQLLPVFAEHCRQWLGKAAAPREIVGRFFAETPILAAFEQRDVEFLFAQLVERQIVLFDALEDAAFGRTHDLNGAGSVSHLAEQVSRDDRRHDLAGLLQRTSTRIVLTAHPTQFYPTTVQYIISDLRAALVARDSAAVERLLLQLGKTRFTNQARPTPVEEAMRVLDVVADIFYEVLPGVVSRTRVAALGHGRAVEDLPRIPNLQIGFWPGGDRDGNPFVTAETTELVARQLRQRLLGCYVASVNALARRLTFEGAYDAVLSVLERLRATQSTTATEALPRIAGASAYEQPRQLREDLLSLRELVLRRHQGLFVELVDELLLKLHLFGFHFAAIDVRQNSDVFIGTVEELARLEPAGSLGKWLELPKDEDRLALLEAVTRNDAELTADTISALTPLAKDTIDTLRVVQRVQAANGAEGLHRVIISHTRNALDVLSVLALARLAGVELERVELDVVPLFETIEDLSAAPEVLGQLFSCKGYREHLRGRQNQQTVMVGFSDGTKDGGYLAANLAIRQAKRAMTAEGRRCGVELVFFDGRGGPPARGGGNTHRFYRSRDRGIDQFHQQLTIQGQTISSNFGSPTLARHHVEQLFTANLENLLWPTESEDPPHRFQALLAELSNTALEAYKQLSEDPLLLEFLSERSPLPLFDYLTIGSRPVSRSRSSRLSLNDLRAIPLVATWSVLKMQVPGYYGLGTALERIIDRGRGAELTQLYRESRFFRTLLDNAAMSLLKSRFDVHAHLEKDAKYAGLFRRLREEAERSQRVILRVSQQTQLLENDPINRRSIEAREQIVLPLLVIVQSAYQGYLEHRAQGTETSTEAQHLRRLSMKGIAAIINATRNAA